MSFPFWTVFLTFEAPEVPECIFVSYTSMYWNWGVASYVTTVTYKAVLYFIHCVWKLCWKTTWRRTLCKTNKVHKLQWHTLPSQSHSEEYPIKSEEKYKNSEWKKIHHLQRHLNISKVPEGHTHQSCSPSLRCIHPITVQTGKAIVLCLHMYNTKIHQRLKYKDCALSLIVASLCSHWLMSKKWNILKEDNPQNPLHTLSPHLNVSPSPSHISAKAAETDNNPGYQ
jgi:hypothetical protein